MKWDQLEHLKMTCICSISSESPEVKFRRGSEQAERELLTMGIQKDCKICITSLKLRFPFAGEPFSDNSIQMSLVCLKDPESLPQ